MRAVFAAVFIIIVIVFLTQIGVGQGETACVRTCQTDHCALPHTESMDCSNDAFRECAAACREPAS